MLQVPIISAPNQTLTFNQDGASWTLHIFQSVKFMCADVSINGVRVLSATRMFGALPVIPYSYITDGQNLGNFVWDSDPDWTNFGDSCNLYYLEHSELGDFQALINSAPMNQAILGNLVPAQSDGLLNANLTNFTLDSSTLGVLS